MSGIKKRKLNLLVVDDDPSIVALVVRILENKLGEEVQITSTSNPLEAQNWIDNHCCDILLSDIEMPGVDGMEMLRFAKRRNAWTTVIFLTGHSTWDRMTDAIENGAADYLLKPINAQDLVQIVSQECGRALRWQKALRSTLQTALATDKT